MTMNSLIELVKILFSNVVSKGKSITFVDIKNVLSWIGLASIIYFIFFFAIQKPQIIKDSEDQVNVLNTEIVENNKELSKLEKENKEIKKEIKKLESDLSDLQIKYKKTVSDYEKNVGNINRMSNNDLSKLFTKTFN